MKIAFCFFGLIRTAEYAVDGILNYIGDLRPNVDFFMHTWNLNEYRRRWRRSPNIAKIMEETGKDYTELSDDIIMPIKPKDTYQIISSLQNIYNFQSTKTDNYNYFFKNYKCNKQLPPGYFSWFESNKLKTNFEILHNFEYDYVVKIRPDLLFQKNRKLKEEIELCSNTENGFFILSDGFYIAKSKIMDQAAEMVYCEDPLYQRSDRFGEYLEMKGIKPIKAAPTIHFAVYRPDSIPTSSLNFEKCYNDDRDWYYPTEDTFRFPLQEETQI